jgi:hypothetical protein
MENVTFPVGTPVPPSLPEDDANAVNDTAVLGCRAQMSPLQLFGDAVTATEVAAWEVICLTELALVAKLGSPP